jgi:AP-2 complex subunit alpha
MNSSSEMKQLIIQNIRNDLQSRNPIFINLALQCVANIGDREMAVAFTNDIPRLLISGLEFKHFSSISICSFAILEIHWMQLNNQLHSVY